MERAIANSNSSRRQGWLGAYLDFLHDPDESRALKSMPLVVLGFGPVDDILLPVVGFIDDIPTAVVALASAVMTINRVRRHR